MSYLKLSDGGGAAARGNRFVGWMLTEHRNQFALDRVTTVASLEPGRLSRLEGFSSCVSLLFAPNFRINFFLVTLILLVSASAQAAEVQTNSALEIKGTITKIDGTGNETNWTDFTVCVFNEKCQVSNLYFNKELLENGTDGTNAYFLNKMTKAKRLIKDWWEWGSVSAGRFPINGMAPGQLCWLAYGSSGYFATNSPAVPMESFQQNAAFLHCEIELSAAQPHLPERIRWYGSNFWYLRANGPGNKESVPYDQGFLAGDYRVTEVTNFQGLHLPAGFEFSVFIPSFFGKKLAPDAVTLVEILRARISSIKAIPMLSDFRPTLGMRAQIKDFRIPSSTNGGYLRVTRLNGEWPKPGDADFQEKVRVGQMLADAKPPKQHSRILFLLLLAVCSLIPLSVAIKQSKQRT